MDFDVEFDVDIEGEGEGDVDVEVEVEVIEEAENIVDKGTDDLKLLSIIDNAPMSAAEQEQEQERRNSRQSRSRSWTDQLVHPEEMASQCELLSNQVYDLQTKLLEQKEINDELSRAKQVLTDEIMDLTRTLFEEANSMVANEARARASLEISRKQLERELEATKEHLKLEKIQLRELREKIYQMRSTHSLIDPSKQLPPEATASESNPPVIDSKWKTLKFNYYDDVFPNRRFDSRLKYDGPTAFIWDQIAKRIEPAPFKVFSRFVETCTTLSEDEFLGHPLMKNIYELDVAPCLTFELKPKSFVKKLVLALFKNTFSMDSHAHQTINAQLPFMEDSNAADEMPAVAESSQIASTPPPQPESNMERVRGIFNHFTASVTSLPDALMSVGGSAASLPLPSTTQSQSESGSPTRVHPGKNPIKFCSFCGQSMVEKPETPIEPSSPLPCIYRVRLMDCESWMCVDVSCRERLVAAGQLYAFLRHLRSGLFSRRPVIDLYYDLCMIRRHLFYARLGVGATQLFLQSDYEQYWALLR